MKYVMYKLVQIKKGQHVFACHKTFKSYILLTSMYSIEDE